MSQEIEVRKIPKKTAIIIGSIIIFGVISFFLASAGKATKATKILKNLGYENITNVRVYASQEFLREDINVKGMKYTVSFTNNKTNEECKGFVLEDYKHNVEKDLLCKKIK
jgi:hypothetical protein